MLTTNGRSRTEPAVSFDGLAIDQALMRAGDGVCVVGSDGRILVWNRAAERILGYTPRDVLGRPCCEIFAGRDDSDNLLCYEDCHVMALIRMGEAVQHFEMRARAKTGQAVWLDVSVLVAPSARGNGSLVMHLFRDVTATKELLTLIHERRPASAGPGTDPSGVPTLTRREVEVLRLVATGLNTVATAERLHVSPATVRNHVQNILGKLGAHNRLEAVAHATRHRLL